MCIPRSVTPLGFSSASRHNHHDADGSQQWDAGRTARATRPRAFETKPTGNSPSSNQERPRRDEAAKPVESGALRTVNRQTVTQASRSGSLAELSSTRISVASRSPTCLSRARRRRAGAIPRASDVWYDRESPLPSRSCWFSSVLNFLHGCLPSHP